MKDTFSGSLDIAAPTINRYISSFPLTQSHLNGHGMGCQPIIIHVRHVRCRSFSRMYPVASTEAIFWVFSTSTTLSDQAISPECPRSDRISQVPGPAWSLRSGKYVLSHERSKQPLVSLKPALASGDLVLLSRQLAPAKTTCTHLGTSDLL